MAALVIEFKNSTLEDIFDGHYLSGASIVRKRNLITIFPALCIFLATNIYAKPPKVVPVAPLPMAISNAKRVFLTNAGGSDLAYDEFYSQIKTWGRFSIAGSPSDADIVIELRYVVEDAGTKVWSSTNTYTGETQVHSHKVVDPQLSINIYESKSKDLLWSVTDHRRLAIRDKNREKETINSADRLVDELKNRIPEDTKVTQPEQPH
jgi:hypothetical protein